MAEWRVRDQLNDPLAVQHLVDTVGSVPAGMASERLLLALPLLVGWLRDDENFPVTIHADLYLNPLTLIALHGAFGENTMGIATILYEAVLGCGLERVRYSDALDLAMDLTGRANGLRHIDWLLDWTSLTVAYPAADADKRQQLLYRILDVLRPLATRMLLRQKPLFESLARNLGLPEIIPALVSQPGAPPESQPNALISLADKTIAIYTLTESVGRQAERFLRELVPDISVALSHDTVGNERLRALAQNADIFVVVTQSAKHTATTFIQRYRDTKPLLFAKGRGISSILAVLEEYCHTLAVTINLV